MSCLIVGAGPVGLFTALELVRRDVDVVLIDVRETPDRLTKASGIHVRTLELLPEAITAKILGEAVHVTRAVIHEHSRVDILDLDSGIMDGIHTQEQWRTEAMLTKHLEELLAAKGRPGPPVRRGVALETLRDDGECVHCSLQGPGGMTTEETYDYVIGADGGRSHVRHLLGVRFEGSTDAHFFVAMHAHFEDVDVGTKDQASARISLSRGGLALAVPLPPVADEPKALSQLVVADLDSDEALAAGVPDQFPTVDAMENLLRRRGLGGPGLRVRPGSVQWTTAFHLNYRLATTFQRGRVLLAGDAAHCHPPTGGQGMNVGLQDAVNLGWKLALVVQGRAAPGLLTTYTQERRAVDANIVRFVRRATAAVVARGSLVTAFRPLLRRMVLCSPGARRQAARTLGMVAHSYAGHALSREVWGWPGSVSAWIGQLWRRYMSARPHAGDRFPGVALRPGTDPATPAVPAYPASGTWRLVVCLADGTAADDAMDALVLAAKPLSPLLSAVHASEQGTLHDLGAAGASCALLVRPDAYIALRVEPLADAANAVQNYVAFIAAGAPQGTA